MPEGSKLRSAVVDLIFSLFFIIICFSMLSSTPLSSCPSLGAEHGGLPVWRFVYPVLLLYIEPVRWYILVDVGLSLPYICLLVVDFGIYSRPFAVQSRRSVFLGAGRDAAVEHVVDPLENDRTASHENSRESEEEHTVLRREHLEDGVGIANMLVLARVEAHPKHDLQSVVAEAVLDPCPVKEGDAQAQNHSLLQANSPRRAEQQEVGREEQSRSQVEANVGQQRETALKLGRVHEIAVDGAQRPVKNTDQNLERRDADGQKVLGLEQRARQCQVGSVADGERGQREGQTQDRQKLEIAADAVSRQLRKHLQVGKRREERADAGKVQGERGRTRRRGQALERVAGVHVGIGVGVEIE